MSKKSLIIYRRREESDKENYDYAKKISKLDKEIYLLSHYNDPKIETEIFKYTNKIYYKNISRIFYNLKYFVNTIIILLNTYINFRGFNNFINNFKVSEIRLGDLIYDTYVRNNYKYLHPKFDFRFTKILFSGIYRTLILEKLIKKIKPKQIFIGTETYINISSICCRLGFKLNIKIIEMSKHHLKIHTKKSIDYGSDSLSLLNRKENFKRFKISKNKLNIFINKRRLNKVKLGATSMHDNKASMGKKQQTIKFIKKIRKLKKNNKKIILFAPHAFSDSCHKSGFFIFTDYFDQVRQTLKIITEKNIGQNLIWVIKRHPSSGKYGENDIIKNYVSQFNLKNILFCDEKISVNEILIHSDAVITGRGTIALEAIANRIPAITAGIARYSGLGIIKDPRNISDYYKNIKNISKNSTKPSKHKAYLAKKIICFCDTLKFNDLI